MTDLTISDKRIIYQILTLIMKSDFIIRPAEVSFLDKVFADFSLSYDEFDHMEELELDSLTKYYEKFTDDKKKYAMQLFIEMAKCDGYVDPRELAIIKKLEI